MSRSAPPSSTSGKEAKRPPRDGVSSPTDGGGRKEIHQCNAMALRVSSPTCGGGWEGEAKTPTPCCSSLANAAARHPAFMPSECFPPGWQSQQIPPSRKSAPGMHNAQDDQLMLGDMDEHNVGQLGHVQFPSAPGIGALWFAICSVVGVRLLLLFASPISGGGVCSLPTCGEGWGGESSQAEQAVVCPRIESLQSVHPSNNIQPRNGS